MKKSYQYILFDWDGCLAKTLQAHLESYKKTFAEYGFFPTDIEITRKVFGDWHGPSKIGVPNEDEFHEKYLARLSEIFANVPLYSNAHSTLKSLVSANKKLALVTSSTTSLIKSAIQKQGVEEYFSIVLAKEDVLEHKPSPEIIYTSLERLGGSKEEAIIIGDSRSDLGAAANAGIDCVLFSPKEHDIFYDREELIENFKPTHVIGNHQELLQLLL